MQTKLILFYFTCIRYTIYQSISYKSKFSAISHLSDKVLAFPQQLVNFTAVPVMFFFVEQLMLFFSSLFCPLCSLCVSSTVSFTGF